MGLGSNVGDTEDNLNDALSRLEAYGDDITLKKMSGLYETEPQEKKDQSWFTNQVIELAVDPEIWSPEGFLSCLQAIEGQLGRTRQEPNGPRVLDMDMIAWGDLEQETGYLDLPHPRAQQRAFVLVPLNEIAPDFVFPDGTGVAEALDKVEFRMEGNRIWQD
ncbi:2-amino-4-hydroxy-6-hydroxymethyldihydropteridine diphosphokinase [Desulfovibrio oxyclinae]|uniref:2-amino-4-hydroxy-6- hydroxymethyldihydropteridine diphosphokinase n=1 Tax=Desulfovibrio oxyclinae TaxID=63560 RepID=UPI00036E33D7